MNGKPGLEPYRGATDFLRAALAPAGDDTPQVHATVVTPAELDAAAMRGQSVVVLAAVDRLAPAQAAALGRFVDAGGGVLIAPGDRVDAAFFNGLGWMPARLGSLQGDSALRQPVAHPAAATFSGPVLSSFAKGDAPALSEADCFAYHVLRPVPGASVTARFDNGDLWAVERPQGRGRVLLLASALDAASGTLPVNPDFVPLTHEWVFHLAGAPVANAADGPEQQQQSSASRTPRCSSRPRPPGSPRAGPWPSKPTRRSSTRASSSPSVAAAASSGEGSSWPHWPASASKST